MTPTELGPALIDVPPDKKRGMLYIKIAGINFAVGLVFLIVFLAGYAGQFSLTVVFWILSIFGALVGWFILRHRFTYHENGIHLQTLLQNKTLCMDEISTFSYSAIDFYLQGAYRGMDLLFTFFPEERANKSKIKFALRVQPETNLDLLRDTLASRFADRMQAQLKDLREISWTDKLTITQEGIKYVKSGLISKSEEFVPFSLIAGHQIIEGKFQLIHMLSKSIILTEKFDVKNFFPGFCLYQRLCKQLS